MEIGNHVGDRDLDDAGVVTFLQHCAEVGAPVFVHPWDMPGGPRLDRWMAQWLTGMPAETHLSILAMILGGVFDRVPATLRICFAHGGGILPVLAGPGGQRLAPPPDVVAARRRTRPRTTSTGSASTPWSSTAALRLLVDTIGARTG